MPEPKKTDTLDLSAIPFAVDTAPTSPKATAASAPSAQAAPQGSVVESAEYARAAMSFVEAMPDYRELFAKVQGIRIAASQGKLSPDQALVAMVGVFEQSLAVNALQVGSLRQEVEDGAAEGDGAAADLAEGIAELVDELREATEKEVLAPAYKKKIESVLDRMDDLLEDHLDEDDEGDEDEEIVQ
jgi:hypothetical protein